LHTKSMTGLSQEQLDLLVDRIADLASPWQPPRGCHRTLSLAAAVTMTLVWLRHNPSQALLGAFYGISQPTVSRIITGLREPIMRVAVQGVPGLAETAPTERLLLDGTLLPTGNRAGQQGQGLYSGKRHKAGMNLQVISDPWGRLLATSDPTPGATGRCAVVCGDRARPRPGRPAGAGRSWLSWVWGGNAGAQPPGGELCELEKVNNRAHASARAAVERTIALLKQWRVVGSGYRGPLARSPRVIRTVVALEKFRIYENLF
jgi:hypothetical protein